MNKNMNKIQFARNRAYIGGNQMIAVPSFNILNPVSNYEGTVMSQRVNELFLNAKRNNVNGGSKLKSNNKTKTKKTKTKKSKKTKTKKSKFDFTNRIFANNIIDLLI